uniref:Reverse transcriptase domain-containing protein n=1 Tax=Tanacetum cinerariifolium TaxID=118510 RepID=A0A6L2L7S5_TANCI|nr:hypothetical protein [Tanacetum cinerariifolium]
MSRPNTRSSGSNENRQPNEIGGLIAKRINATLPELIFQVAGGLNVGQTNAGGNTLMLGTHVATRTLWPSDQSNSLAWKLPLGIKLICQGKVTSSNPTTLHAAISMTYHLATGIIKDGKIAKKGDNGKKRKDDKQKKQASRTFSIDLIPIELKSFNVVVGIDWLTRVRAYIDCNAKIVQRPLVNGGTLIVQGNKSRRDLKLISAIKMRRYPEKDCVVFLAHAVDKGVRVKDTKDIRMVPPCPSLCLPEIKQLAINMGDEYGFVIRLYLVRVTFKSVKIEL